MKNAALHGGSGDNAPSQEAMLGYGLQMASELVGEEGGVYIPQHVGEYSALYLRLKLLWRYQHGSCNVMRHACQFNLLNIKPPIKSHKKTTPPNNISIYSKH